MMVLMKNWKCASTASQKLQGTLLQLLGLQLRDYWPWYLIGTMCLVVTHYIQSFLPQWALDLTSLIGNDEANRPIIKFLLLAIGIIIFRTLSRLLYFNPARYMQKSLRLEMLKKLEKTNPDRYEAYSDGQIFQVLFSDIEQVRAVVGFAVLQVFNALIAFAVIVPKMMSIHQELLWGLIPLLLVMILFSWIVLKIHPLFELAQKYQGDVQNYLMESYDAKQTIKNYHSENSFLELFKEHVELELKTFYQSGRIMSWISPLIALGLGLSFVLGGFLVWKMNADVSLLILFSGFCFLLMEPMGFVVWVAVVIMQGKASWNRVKSFLSTLEQPTMLEQQLAVPIIQNKITLPFWDRHLNLDLNHSIIALVGPTGHGKSEILKRVALSLKEKNTQVAFVAQSPYLYNDTLRGNIFLGLPQTAESILMAQELIEIFGLQELRNSQENLLDLELGENGHRVSGGQAKRIALIRSLLSPATVLIWDDPFSSVDPFSETPIWKTLIQKKIIGPKGKKIILSTHRFTTARVCDQIYFINKNKDLFEVQSKEQLLTIKTGSIYEFFQAQII